MGAASDYTSVGQSVASLGAAIFWATHGFAPPDLATCTAFAGLVAFGVVHGVQGVRTLFARRTP